ncbi:lipoprotein [Longimycelium tulufanense]|uniref:Lipoprotein n=1 Tax=Longimycelium tulufanense TaxID=907463 RepID=A0A8J3CC60_9PSEU|nr:extracellular solute-binding protein [Longimycelium tulufanense]GGM47238.1 lipoprotein [Longimycelium tulufanense]
MVRYGSRTRRLSAALLAGALTLSLTGCGSSGGRDENVVTYWSMWKENEPQAQVLHQTAAAFERDTGTKVDIQWQGRDVLKKIVPALRGGEVPDLVDQDQNLMRATLVSSGAYRDLTGLYNSPVSDGRKVSDVIAPRYADAVKNDGKPFLAPYEVIGYGLWFDASQLPEVAAKPPRTWREFVELLAHRKAAGRAPLALDADIGQYNNLWTTGLLQGALGAEQVNQLAADHSGEAWRRHPGVRPVLEEIATLVRDGYFVPGYNGSKWPAIQEKWAQGEADFLLMGSWAPSETGAKARPGFQYHFAPLPTPGDQRYVPVESIGFAIPARAQHAGNAERFIAYVLRDEHLGKIATVAKNLTPNPELPAPPELTSLAEAAEQLHVARSEDGIQADYPGYTEEVLWPVNNQFLKGQLDIEGFFQQLKEKQANYWKKKG